MGLIPEEKIAEVRDRTDIVQVIGEFVPLRKSGVNWKGLCPFHAERSPSFNVNQAKQMYHCFGCGKSGDVIRFLVEHEGKTFLEVVRELAKRAGIQLPEPEVTPAERDARRRAESDRSRMLQLNRLVSDWLRGQYTGQSAGQSGERARAYVEGKRGVSPKTLSDFAIGYAPPGWDALTRFLEAQRVPHELCEAAGLVRAREQAQAQPGGSATANAPRPPGSGRLPPGAPPTRATHFDLFRDRIMFPLLSPQSEVIAFSGRALDDVGPDGQRIPKYINSPETLLYKKGEQLYGLHLARTAIRKAERSILVEGNFDVLLMHERGFPETVAPMGTALTAAQVRLLGRSAPKKVYMLLDGDAAGSSAAARNVGLFLDEDQLAFVATLPAGEDPDTFVRGQGPEALDVLLEHAREAVEYFCEYGWSRTGQSIIERARLLEEEAAPIIRKVRLPAARQRYAERLALTLDLPVDSVQRLLRGSPSGSVVHAPSAPRWDEPPKAPSGGSEGPVAPPSVRPDPIDLELVALLSDQPRLGRRLAEILDCIISPQLRAAIDLGARAAAAGSSARIDFSSVGAVLDSESRRDVMAAALRGHYADDHDPDRALEAVLRRRGEKRREILLADLRKKVAEARSSGDHSGVRQLTTQISDLLRARHGLAGSEPPGEAGTPGTQTEPPTRDRGT